MKKQIEDSIISIWADKIREALYSRPIFLKPTNELIKDYLKLSNRQWLAKRNLKDIIFNEILRDYLENNS